MSLPQKVCMFCGKSFHKIGRSVKRYLQKQYCSRACANIARQNTLDNVHKRIQVDPVTGCHNWTGTQVGNGYGQVKIAGNSRLVHRFIWEAVHGPVPESLELDHICRNRACCNPEHLRVVTARENVLASDNLCAQNARKLVCPRCGGPYDIHTRYDGREERVCRPCNAAYYRNRYHNNDKIRKYLADYYQQRRTEDPEYRQRRLEATKRYRERKKNGIPR